MPGKLYNASAQGSFSDGNSTRFWRFGDCEFDELGRQLWVKGEIANLESKALDVLLYLLLHAGEVVTNEELLESVWPDVIFVDGSLTVAISNLREAIRDAERSVIVTVPRIGYQIATPVHCKMFTGHLNLSLGLTAGSPVPRCEQWQLTRPLDPNASNEVWLAEHLTSAEQRVFKFASDGNRMRCLKREIAISRYLREALGDRPEFVRLLKWNLETKPCFVECEYAGLNLLEWSASGALTSMSVNERLKLVLGITRAVADAHSLGVLHKDLRPANILVVPGVDGGWQTSITDFGCPSLFEPSRLLQLGISNLGFAQTEPPTLSESAMYIAPEVLAGHSASTAADVYSLGILLYQALVGDFKRPLAAGWEDEIVDPILRGTIANATCSDPAKRLTSVAALAERLSTLEECPVHVEEAHEPEVLQLPAEDHIVPSHMLRPWVAGLMVALTAGLVFTIIQYRRVVGERNFAARQIAIAESMNRFLSADLLGRSDPLASGNSDLSLLDAIHQATPDIDKDFQREPLVAARLHQAIARVLDHHTDYSDARAQYARAADLFRQAEGDRSQNGMIVQLQRAALEARSSGAGSLRLAKAIAEQQQALIRELAEPRPDLEVWDTLAKGTIALSDNDPRSAAELFEKTIEGAAGLQQFDRRDLLEMKQQLALCYSRLGDGAKAEKLYKELIAEFTAIAGPDSPGVLRARLDLAQAYMLEKKHAVAIQEVTAIYPEIAARLGADHALTMQLLATRAQSEESLGLWDDAIRDDLAINAVAVKDQGPLSSVAIETLSDASLAQCRAGRLQEGARNARAAFDASLKAFGVHAGLTGGTAHALASCLAALNRLNDASWLLTLVNVPAVSQLAGDPDFGARVKLIQADIAKHQGKEDKLKRLLDEIGPVFTRADAETYEKQLYESLASAQDGLARSASLVQSQAVIMTGVKP